LRTTGSGIRWSMAGEIPSWLSVTPDHGDIAADSSIEVVVMLMPRAEALTPGSYDVRLEFKNDVDGTTIGRAVHLVVSSRLCAVSLASRAAQPLSSAEECALKPKDVFKECDNCPVMVVIPAGAFRMGSPDSEVGHSPDEAPVRTVTIGRPFAAGKFEVTWDEWEACVTMGGCDGRQTTDSGYGKGRRPVINVSWNQAKAYAAWLSQMTNKPYRLLTEAEWEYAARGVTSADAPHPPFPWSDKASHEYANYGNDRCCDGKAEGRDTWINTAPVGQFPPNAFDLYDMHGNVTEWVQDAWHNDYRGKPPSDGSTWTEDGDDRLHVARGGSWNSNPTELRSANRNWYTTIDRGSTLGFRVARTLTP
jgi:formylglycine-generating enzyme required for sulfatase activity